MSTMEPNGDQLLKRTLTVMFCALLFGCSDGVETAPDSSAPPARSNEDLSSEEFVQAFNLRESDVAVRDLPGWAPPKRVVVVVPEEWDRQEERIAFLQAVAPGVELVPVMHRQDALDRGVLQNAQVVIGLGCGASTVAAVGPETHWIQSGSVGVEGCFMDRSGSTETNRILRERNIVVTALRGMTARAISQHSFTLMLSLIGGMDIHADRQRDHIWGRTTTDVVKDKNLDMEFQDQTLLVVGLGSLGTEVARLAHAVGMRVVATRNTSRTGPDFVDYVGLSDEMYTLAGQADVVFASVPSTPATQGMFDARFFDAMKETAYFVSIVRNPVIIWDDLKDALRLKKIAGYGTDDLPQQDFELWDMPRVIMTPHVSDYSNHYRDNQYLLYRENLRRYIAGDRMLNVVDLQRGY
jgi:phosphoglycerate dehydrogenase-like enzyme